MCIDSRVSKADVIHIHNGIKKLMLFAATCGEGNGTPLQYSCLENPMDGGAW